MTRYGFERRVLAPRAARANNLMLGIELPGATEAVLEEKK